MEEKGYSSVFDSGKARSWIMEAEAESEVRVEDRLEKWTAEFSSLNDEIAKEENRLLSSPYITYINSRIIGLGLKVGHVRYGINGDPHKHLLIINYTNNLVKGILFRRIEVKVDDRVTIKKVADEVIWIVYELVKNR